MLCGAEFDGFTVVILPLEEVSFLCQVDGELNGVGLRRLAVTTRLPVLTRTYGRLGIVSGMVVPKCVEVLGDKILGDDTSSLPDVMAANGVAFLRT